MKAKGTELERQKEYPNAYYDEHGLLNFVACVTAGRKVGWRTVRKNPFSPGFRPFKLPVLPLRDTAAEAETDLATYARQEHMVLVMFKRGRWVSIRVL
jgi:hypothetical protein